MKVRLTDRYLNVILMLCLYRRICLITKRKRVRQGDHSREKRRVSLFRSVVALVGADDNDDCDKNVLLRFCPAFQLATRSEQRGVSGLWNAYYYEIIQCCIYIIKYRNLSLHSLLCGKRSCPQDLN